MLFYINTSEHEFKAWLYSFCENTPLATLLPEKSKLILGSPQPSISSLLREPIIVIPGTRHWGQNENDSANSSEQNPWVIQMAAKMENYVETINALSISIKPIGLGQRVLVSIVEGAQDISPIAQKITQQICERWTGTLLQAENTPPLAKRKKFLVSVESLNDFEWNLTKSFVPNFRPSGDVQEISCEPRTVNKVIRQNSLWNTFPFELKGLPSETFLTLDNQSYQHEHSRAWVLTVKLVRTSSNAVHGFDINVGSSKTGSLNKSHFMVWDYPETFSHESEIVLQNFLQSYNDTWQIKQIEPSANANTANGTIEALSKEYDKGKKKALGRRRDPDHEWAREQVYNLGRPPEEVYKEWLERNNSDRATRLSDAKDTFDKLLRKKPRGT